MPLLSKIVKRPSGCLQYLYAMKTINLQKRNLLLSIIREKCPNCNEGHVFRKSAGIFKMPVMNRECPVCRYKFDREPGYFLGAMYISYAIAVLTGIITFLALHLLAPGLPTIYVPIAIVLVIVAIARKNYKVSRIIYIHIFPW